MFDSVRWLNVRKLVHLLIHASGFSYNVLIYALVLLTTTIYVKKLKVLLNCTVKDVFRLHTIRKTVSPYSII